jgi:glycosyltransferase involved in cell wall biosynthesis
VWSEIRSGKYDAVWLHGYNYAVSLIAWAAAKTGGLPVLMRSETHLGLRRTSVRRRIRDRVLALAYRSVDAFLAIGSANRDYYRAIGVSSDRIFDVPYTVDNDRFMSGARAAAPLRSSIRRRLGLPLDLPVVLYASKLTPRKHPDVLLRAVAELQRKGRSMAVLIVGTGELETRLRELARTLDLENAVFAGFVNQSELPDVYSASDVFVLGSEDEPWGLIVNEVMCAGLPVVVSDEAGCQRDLLRDGVNGLRVRAGDVDSLAAALDRLVGDERERCRMGAASLSIISEWNYERCSKGLTMALAQVCGR